MGLLRVLMKVNKEDLGVTTQDANEFVTHVEHYFDFVAHSFTMTLLMKRRVTQSWKMVL